MEVVGNSQIDEIKLEAEHKWLGSLRVDKIQLGLLDFYHLSNMI